MTPSLCLETFFLDQPFLRRMELAKAVGYRAVSFWSWKDKDLPAIRRASRKLGLRIACFSGNRRFTLIHPGHRTRLMQEVTQALKIARQLECPSLCLLSDKLLEDGRAAPLPAKLSRREKKESLVEGLRQLSKIASTFQTTLLLEPLNTRVDHPGCFLNSFAMALEAVQQVGQPNLKILYDIYHMSVMGEDVVAHLRKHLRWIGGVDVADAPGRHEPGTGRIDYAAVFKVLRRLKYRGVIGMEFFPSSDHVSAAARGLALVAGDRA